MLGLGVFSAASPVPGSSRQRSHVTLYLLPPWTWRVGGTGAMGTGGQRSPYRGCIVASSCSKRAVLCSDTAPAACRLTGAERAAASAEETDIDAVELPLPGADILDFSRGVTDLDAVGKEASTYADAKVRESLPSTLGARHGRGPTALMRVPGAWGSGGIVQHSPAPRSKPSATTGLPFGLGPRALPESSVPRLSYVQPHGKCLGQR